MHVITGLQTGGAERMLEKLVTGMPRTAYENIVVSLMDDGVIGPQLRAGGIAVHSLGIRSIFSLPSGLLRLHRLLRQYRPQILQTWLYHADLVGVAAGLLHRDAILVWNIRCSDMDLTQYNATTRLILRLLALCSARPDLVIGNSDTGRRHHIGLGYRARRWAVIPNGFDLEKFRIDPSAAPALRRSLGLAQNVRLVGMVARFDPMKDHATFVDMAARLHRDRPDTHFLLAGRGCDAGTPLLAAAAARMDGHLHLLGERSDIPHILAGLDLMVLSSAYGEGFANVLGEALASGTPCIATDVGDATAIIGDCGATVPPRRPDLLAGRVAEFLDLPPAERLSLQQRARQRIETHFALPAIIARYQRLYDETIGRRAVHPASDPVAGP